VRDNRVVRWRRLLFLAVLLIVGASLVSAVEPRDRGSTEAPIAGNPPAPVVEAALPADKEVRARVGDVIRLVVRAPSADTVELTTLGVEEPVDVNEPAEIVFVANQAGRFRVRLRDAGESIGTLRVTS
jgi:hypothetical protein